MGITQLDKIDKLWLLRKKIYQNYQRFFKNYHVEIQSHDTNLKNYKHAYHLFIIHFKQNKNKNIRNKLIKF